MTPQTLEGNMVDVLAHGPRQSTDNKYLTFQLAGEEFGIEILKVREIIKVVDITAVPQMPSFMKGVVNLRGKVTPIVDMRLKFGMPEAEHTAQTCIIVVNVGTEIGIVVDTVSEVLDIPGENIAPAPSIGRDIDSSFILGMGKVGEEVKILLEIDQVLNADQLSELLTSATSVEASSTHSRG